MFVKCGGTSASEIAGSAMSARYFGNGKITCCFAGDGAYNNGVVMESLNWAAMGQFTLPEYAGEQNFGLPIFYALINNRLQRLDLQWPGVCGALIFVSPLAVKAIVEDLKLLVLTFTP